MGGTTIISCIPEAFHKFIVNNKLRQQIRVSIDTYNENWRY